MNLPLVVASLRRATVAAVAAALLFAQPAAAAGHRARLSADLEDHLVAGSATIDVIVSGTRAEVDALAAKYNLTIKKYLKSGAVLKVTAGQLAAITAEETVDHLSGDIKFRASEITTESIGADQVWTGSTGVPSLTGAGIGIAVIDSGIDPAHFALKKHVVANVDFTGGNGVDLYGHGTHVAAIIAGQPGRTADTSSYRGVASGANIVNLRVLGADGSGYASDLIEAIDWAIDHRKAYNIKVINLSLGTPVMQPYRDDPVCDAVERAIAAGIVVVVAAGNNGQTPDGKKIVGGIMSPGNDPNAITVAAIDANGTAFRSDDFIAKYSSRGPTRYDLVLKPDLAAPGSHIVSAEAAGSYLSKTYSTRHVAGSGADAYMQLSGTSMATGVVSGAVALLLEKQKQLSPRDAKAVLQMTSSFMPDEGLLAAGAGSLNVLAATQLGPGHVKTDLHNTVIGGETVSSTGLSFTTKVFAQNRAPLVSNTSIFWGTAKPLSIFWGTSDDSIFWGTSDDSIFWGTKTASIFWGTSDDSIFWGTKAASIFWGTSDDSIFWGTNAASIFWGTSDDSIFWGTSDDSIFWGTNDDSIFWGTSDDSIFWGTALAD